MSRIIVTIAAAACLAGGATAQTAPAGRSAGLGGLLGGALPGLGSGVGSIGAGNAAGLLGYCLKNNLLGQGGALGALTGGRTASGVSQQPAPATSARSILQRLTDRQGVRTSPGYAAGQAGQVQAGSGQALSLESLGGQVKTRMCDLVLNRAKSFL